MNPESSPSAPAPSRGEAPAASPKPLRWPEILGYACGDVGFGFYWKTFEFFLLYFYTDVYGLPPAVAGTMFLVMGVFDAAVDPIMGMWADRTRTRFGSFRPFVLISALPLAVFGVLTFTTPSLSTTGKVLWAGATYGITMLGYTLGNIPYGAMLGVLTSDVRKRTTLSSMKQAGAFAGGVLVTAYTKSLVAWLGAGDPARGWQRTMMVYGCIAATLLTITFVTTRERVRPHANQRTSVRQDLKDLTTNRPWLTLFGVGFVVMLTIAVRNGTGVYYLKYYAKRDDLTATFLTMSSVAYLAGAVVTPFLSRFFGKKALLTLLMVGVGALSISLYFVPRANVWWMIGVAVMTSFVLGPKSPLTWAMYADAADYSEWRTGRRATALVFSSATFGVKAGGAVAQWLVGLLLSGVGYVANRDQTPGALHGILLLATVIPGAFALLAAALVQLYPLNTHKTLTIQHELEARRG